MQRIQREEDRELLWSDHQSHAIIGRQKEGAFKDFFCVSTHLIDFQPRLITMYPFFNKVIGVIFVLLLSYLKPKEMTATQQYTMHRQYATHHDHLIEVPSLPPSLSFNTTLNRHHCCNGFLGTKDGRHKRSRSNNQQRPRIHDTH